MNGFRVKKLILLRLLFGTVLLYAPSIFQETSAAVFYGAVAAVCVLSGIYLTWYLTRRRLRLLARIQFVGDVLLETYLVFLVGGTESIFAIFYVLTILSTSLVLGDRKTILQITWLSSLSYFAASLSSYNLGTADPLTPRDPVYFLYGTMLRIVIFFTVGHFSRFLSGQILELQEKLKLSERLAYLGEAASKIAHEVRNPLSSIKTAAEVLRDSLAGKLSPQDEKMVSIVESEADRLTQTLQRILNYAKQVPPNPKPLLVDSLIDRTLSLVELRSHLHSNGVVVEKKYEPGRIHIYADEEQILSALLNLILNAYQAMSQGGTLSIIALEESAATKISLQDTGGGMPQEKLKDLFVPFKSTKKGGTGLGLAEVHKIVTLHGGKIEVESQVGKGTAFHLFFPNP